MKKAIVCLLVLSLMMFIVACTKSDETSTTTRPTTTRTTTTRATTSTEEESDEIKIVTCWWPMTLPTGRAQLNQLDTRIGALMAERTGLAFEINYLTGGDSEQAFNLKLASKNWEDVLYIGKNQVWVEKLVEANVIESVESFFNQPDKYPNLAAVPKEVLDNYRFTDDHLYYFPDQWYEDVDNPKYGYWCFHGWYVHPEYLEAVNMTASDLTSLSGIEKFLKAIKDADLKTEDGLSVLPMSSGTDLSFTKVILTTFGLSDTRGKGFDIYDGEIINFRQHPNTKKAYEWMNKLYLMGVIDPEFSTQTNDILVEKLMNRRIALMPNPAIDFWNAVTAGQSPATELTYIAFPKVDGVDKLGTALTYNPYGSGGWLLNKNNPYKDAVAKAADYLSTKGEYRFWEGYMGPQGELWDWDTEKGEPYFEITDSEFAEISASGDYRKMEDFGYAFLPRLSPMGLDQNFFNKNTQETLKWIFDMHRFNVEQGYHRKVTLIEQVVLPSEGAWATNGTNIQSIDLQYSVKLITAKDNAEFEKVWNEYQAQLESMGKISQVINEFITAYNEQKSN